MYDLKVLACAVIGGFVGRFAYKIDTLRRGNKKIKEK